MAVTSETIRIEVAYALPDKQTVIALECPFGTTISQAIKRSGILAEYPELATQCYEVGVHGQKQVLEYRVSDQDRVEIYRPLQVTPTEARRLRALERNKRSGSV
ncbi:MAG: RnfH family protein [Gammaproteobacteria bacterium]|nr:RnfH family protein [Gammaproteobacteria bacterium]